MTQTLSEIISSWPIDAPFCARTAASKCSHVVSNDQLYGLAIEECLDAIDRNSQTEISQFLHRFPEIADRLLPALGAIPQVIDHDWPRIGNTIDEHKIIQHLGFGESSRVYLTEDGKSGGRATVLKITVTPTNEAVYLARLHHPSVCTLYQVARDGRHIFLQYVAGPNAMAFLSSHAATEEERSQGSAVSREYYRRAAVAIERIASAIDHIHDRGVAHNDIKPSNIIIGESQTLLIDFDAASEIGVHGARRPIGTIDYLSNESLEELARNGQMVSQNCIHDDHFAFAVTCFEILTGTLPWKRHRNEATPALCRELLEERRGISVESVMAKMMPQALAQEFTHIFNSRFRPPCPVLLAKSIMSHYGAAVRRRHRTAMGAAVASIILFVLLIVLSVSVGAHKEQSTVEASSPNSAVVADPNHFRPSMQPPIHTPRPLSDRGDTYKDHEQMPGIDESKLSSKDAARLGYFMFLAKPDHERQVRLYEITISKGDANAAVWNNYGFSLACSRRLDEARKAFLAAVQHDPSLPQPYLHLATLDEAFPGKLGAAPPGVNVCAAMQRIPNDPIVRRLAASALKSLGSATYANQESLETANRLLKLLTETRHLPLSQPITLCVNPFPTAPAQAAKSVIADHTP